MRKLTYTLSALLAGAAIGGHFLHLGIVENRYKTKIRNLEGRLTNQEEDQRLIDESYAILRRAMEISTRQDGIPDVLSPAELRLFLRDIGVNKMLPVNLENGNISYDVLPDEIRILLNGEELLGTTTRETLLSYIKRNEA